jgi:predicted anti-sigma-YlaC factor YlaD
MNCDEVRELYLADLTGDEPKPEGVDRHLEACPACRQELPALAATWAALEALPLIEPDPRVGRKLHRRVRWEAARETLVSLQRWQQAALLGVVGFAVSVLLALVVPYETMVAACREIVPAVLPTPVAYALAGVLYGLVPLLVATAFQARWIGGAGVVGVLEAPVVFLVALLPYVLFRCGDFPLALLTGFVGGIAAGAVAGGGLGTVLGRRHAWV